MGKRGNSRRDITKITNKKGGGKKVERMRCSPRKWRINAGERERRKHDAKIQQRMMNKPQRVDEIGQRSRKFFNPHREMMRKPLQYC